VVKNKSAHESAYLVNRFEVGDRVRVDIPDQTDPDHDPFHGLHGTVVEVSSDDAALVNGDERDSLVYRVDLDSGPVVDLRWRDLRPPVE